MVTRTLYSLLLYLLLPLILMRLLWRGVKAPAYRRRWGERFALYRGEASRVKVWIHTVSVGEFVATIPLIRALCEEIPAQQILVTTMTPTGSARVKETFGDQVQHVYLPYDLPDAVVRFLRHFHPTVALVMETELWSNLFHHCAARQIPLLLGNVRLSQRSLKGYQRWIPRLAREALQQVSWAAVQGEADRGRLIELGMNAGSTEVTGSIKFDLTLPESLQEQGVALREALGASRPVWIAASTREGEEGYILDAHRQVVQQMPDALLLLVPRHPERFDGVARQVQSTGFELARRSQDIYPHPSPPPARGRALDSSIQVYLGDTMGEMLLLYAASDVTYVGGSLVPTGSHNMLEPAALGKPVLFGPHRFNFAEISQMLIDQGAACEVQDANKLAAQVIDLLQRPDRRAQMGAQGVRVVEQNRGALLKLLQGIKSHLPESQ